MGKASKIMYVVMLIIAIIFTFSNIVKAKTVEITTETLNLRKEASTDSDIVAQISVGEECEVLEDEGDWYKVQYGNYTGYVSKEYTKVVGGEDTKTTEDNTSGNDMTSDEPEETSTNGTTEEPQANTNQINNETETDSNTQSSSDNNGVTIAKLNKDTDIRIVPLINGSIIDSLKANTEVTIVTQTSGWANIQSDTISGWVRADTLTIENTSNNGNTEDNKNNSDKTDTTDTKGDNEDTNSPEENTSDFEEQTMFTTDYVNIRKEPSTSSDRLMTVEKNTALTVVGETGDWYKVETSQGNAYVLKELLSDKEVSTTTRGGVDRTSENETQDKSDKKEAEVTTSTSNSSDNSAKADEIIAYAKKFLGVPYVYGGESPSGFDCSGFTMYVYNQFDISMRHGAQAQAKLGKAVNVNKSSESSILKNLKKGDLVFFLDYETMDEIGHCGIYIGDGDFIHASSGSGYCVKINSLLPGEYYNTRYCAARRVL